MNYFDYINTLEPNPELKNKTKEKVQTAFQQQSKTKTHKKYFILSAAACFAIMAVSISSYNHFNQDTIIVPNNSVVITTTNNYDKKIIVNTAKDNNKYGPLYIVVDGKVYKQYCDNNKKASWGDDNGNIELYESDFGEKICELNADNMSHIALFTESKTMTDSEAKQNKFYKAKIYKYTKCKNDAVLLAQTEDDYYMFELCAFSLTESLSTFSPKDIIDFYTASGKNSIISIEVEKAAVNDDYEETNEQLPAIKDENAINSIINILKDCTEICPDDMLLEVYSNSCDENDKPTGIYYLQINYADGTSSIVNIYKGCIELLSSQIEGDWGYKIDDSDYNSLIKLINN